MHFSDLRDVSDNAADLASTSLRRMSNVSLPDVSHRDVSLPHVSVPHVSVPHVSMPDISMPHVSMPHVSMPDISLPDAPDVDVAALAGSAADFAGEVAGVVVTQTGRGISQVIRSARRNPKAAIGVAAIVVLVIGLIAARKRSSKSSLDELS